MSATLTFTARQVSEMQRAAFVAGAMHATTYPTDTFAVAAASFYPPPKVTRSRVVKDPILGNTQWHVERGEIVGEVGDCGHWYTLTAGDKAFRPVAARVTVWADLLANPTEEVEAES